MLKNKKNNKEKAKQQRILSIYSQPGEGACKATSLPLKKANRSSICNPKPKEPPKRQKLKTHASTNKIKPPEVYERVPISITSSNSEIEFSCAESKQEPRLFKRHLSIDCDEQALIREIWQVGRKRKNLQHQAATKIQKVFRGYLTRRLLLKYVQQYEEKLIEEQHRLRRKATYADQDHDSFYSSELKQSYFSALRDSAVDFKCRSNSKEKPSIFQAESSIAINEYEHYQSMQDNQFLLKPAAKPSFVDPASLTLNESSIAQQQEISLSFGHQAHPSPHFVPAQVPQRNASRETESPNKLERGVSTISEDKTRDGASQNISMSKQEKEDASNLSSMKKAQFLAEKSELYDPHVERLRSSEKAKWEQVIKLVHTNLQENLNVDRTKILMSTLLEFSVKNREELNKLPHQQDNEREEIEEPLTVTPTAITHRFQAEDNRERRDFKKKRWGEHESQPIKAPWLRRERESLFERTQKMKQHFLQNMLVEDVRIDKMLELRQSILRRKESNCLVQLNALLENNLLTQDQFIERLAQLSNAFHQQKSDIQQARRDIYQGYRAQLQLFRSTALDARFLGCRLPFSRSMQIFPNYPRWKFDDVMIDQLNLLSSRRKQRSNQLKQPPKLFPTNSGRREQERNEQERNEQDRKEQDRKGQDRKGQEQEQEQERELFIESDEEQVSFTYEQVKMYKKCQLFSLDNSDMDSNQIMHSPKNMKQVSPFGRYSAVSLFQELPSDDKADQKSHLQSICKREQKQPLHQEQEQKCLKRERYEINLASSDQEDEQPERADRNVDELVQCYAKKLIWQAVADLYCCSSMLKNCKLKRSRIAMQPVSSAQRLQFLEQCMSDLPAFTLLKGRINQKMYPNSKELLISMREIDEDQEQSQYLEIGQYEYILNQETCFAFIESYLGKYKNCAGREAKGGRFAAFKHSDSKSESKPEFKQEYQQFASDRLKNKVTERKAEAARLLESVQESREQMLRIELHCLLDAWNEQLIKYRENKLGYSGIGLNEISQSLIDRICRPLTKAEEYAEMMRYTKDTLARVCTESASQRLSNQYSQAVSRNDSQWILYTQEALEYGFDLAKIVEIQLIFECLDEIHSLPRAQSPLEQSYSSSASFDAEEQRGLERKLKEMQECEQSEEEDSFYR